ncbi:MAG: MFS transporter [Betaproteobacteria bacterium]|nr:MFS transporter [Betaproteobacteria bacterium]
MSAYLADLTRDEVRTRAMAIVGASIGLSFALSLVLAPPLYGVVGLSGLFLLTAALALAATWTVWRMPNPAITREALLGEQRSWMSLLRDSQLQSLNLGVFVMMSIQTAMFVAIPIGLDHLGMGLSEHWKVYLPLLLLAFVAMAPFILWAERAGRNKPLFMASIAVLFGSMLMFWFIPAAEDHLWSWLSALWVFMLGFNLLEALLPSWVSRVAPPAQRGQALGIYNTSQSLGLFAGGLAGGLVAKNFGSEAIFLACAIVILLWALASARLKEVSTRHEAQAA